MAKLKVERNKRTNCSEKGCNPENIKFKQRRIFLKRGDYLGRWQEWYSFYYESLIKTFHDFTDVINELNLRDDLNKDEDFKHVRAHIKALSFELQRFTPDYVKNIQYKTIENLFSEENLLSSDFCHLVHVSYTASINIVTQELINSLAKNITNDSRGRRIEKAATVLERFPTILSLIEKSGFEGLAFFIGTNP